jgi:hypothetical protein
LSTVVGPPGTPPLPPITRAPGAARPPWGFAKETGLTRQTVYRIKDDPAGAEAALAAWGL